MSLLKKIEKKRLNTAVFECISKIIQGTEESWFELKDPTGHYCFAPSDLYCPLRYYIGLEIEPANCKGDELRREIYESKRQSSY